MTTENRDFVSKFCSFWPIRGVIFYHFLGQKSRFFDFFKVILDLFGKSLGFFFGVKVPIFVLFATRNWVSPLGSREALINVDNAPPGLFIWCVASRCIFGWSFAIFQSCLDFFTPTNLGLYSPKERFLKEPHRGVPFVWVLSFLYLIDFKILPPYDTNFSMSYCVGWVWCGVGVVGCGWVWGVFTSKIF